MSFKYGFQTLGAVAMKNHDLDSLARRLVQRTFELIGQQSGKELDAVGVKFIYEAYLHVKEILLTSGMIDAQIRDVEHTLVGNLAMGLYMVVIVWVQEKEIPSELIPQLKEIVTGVLADPSSWAENGLRR
jgi:hypothetical protein